MASHGGAGTRYSAGCRCKACRAANTARIKRRRRERYTEPLPDGIAHNAFTYSNWGCRCELCSTAHSAALLEGKARRLAGSIPANIRHGRHSTYNGWGCRCWPCTKAAATYHRNHRTPARTGSPSPGMSRLATTGEGKSPAALRSVAVGGAREKAAGAAIHPAGPRPLPAHERK